MNLELKSFQTEEFQKIAAVVSIFTNLVLIYLILTKSPKIMGSYKYLLIYITIFNMLYSIIDFLATPIIHAHGSAFVVIVKFHETILGKETASILNVFYCGFYGCSIVIFDIIFIYRYLVSIGSPLIQTFNNWKIILWFSLPLIYGVIWSIIMFLLCSESPKTDEYLRANILQTLGLQLDEISYTGPYLDDEYGLISIILLTSLVTVSFAVAATFGIKCYLRLTSLVRDAQTASSSSQTRALQNQLFRALVAQALIPLFLMYIPAFVLCGSTIVGIGIGELSGFVAITISLFPVLDPFPSIVLIKSYRDAVWEFFQKVKSIKTRNSSGGMLV